MDHGALARAIFAGNESMTLATAGRPPARHRLYRAIVSQHWLLDPDRGGVDIREPVTP